MDIKNLILSGDDASKSKLKTARNVKMLLLAS